MKTAYIVGAGELAPERLSPEAGDLVIAADAGLTHLRRLGIEPDLILGDFDSLGHIPEGDRVEVCPVEKDYTDTQLALRRACERGYRRCLIFGGTGGRLDHTLANIQCLANAEAEGVEAVLIGRGYALRALSGGRLIFPAGYCGGYSVFAQGGTASGVSERGGKYELTDTTLLTTNPLGVSNSFMGGEVQISVRSGTLIVYWEDDPALPLPRRAEL